MKLGHDGILQLREKGRPVCMIDKLAGRTLTKRFATRYEPGNILQLVEAPEFSRQYVQALSHICRGSNITCCRLRRSSESKPEMLKLSLF